MGWAKALLIKHQVKNKSKSKIPSQETKFVKTFMLIRKFLQEKHLNFQQETPLSLKVEEKQKSKNRWNFYILWCIVVFCGFFFSAKNWKWASLKKEKRTTI